MLTDTKCAFCGNNASLRRSKEGLFFHSFCFNEEDEVCQSKPCPTVEKALEAWEEFFKEDYLDD